ncbi:MAG TPA: agmatinase [Actinomycetota bacterium]|nr:agmatinase [Actinomycetota bacterium]
MRVNRPSEPSYAGGATFSKLPLVLDPQELRGADVAILGAPIDETTSHRPGARFGPRAIRLADVAGGSPPGWPHLDLGVDAASVLRIVDHGDAEVRPADAEWSHAALRRAVRDVVSAGCVPVVLGGDHSIAHPNVSAMAEHFGAGTVGIIHFDAHADDAAEVYGVERSHGTPMRLLVEEGSVRGDRIVQVGLRGYWPDPEDFDWAREQGFVWYTMAGMEELGLSRVLDEVIERASAWERVWLSIDVDVADPAYAPGTGTPEPGGLTARELLGAVRRLALEVGFDGMEVVEVCPPYDHADITALLAHRVVLEALSGLAVRRSGGSPRPERPR